MNCILVADSIGSVENLRQKQSDWIDAILAAKGWSLSELASRARVSPTTLTRWRNSAAAEAELATLSTRTIDKIEQAAAVRAYEQPGAGNGRPIAATEAEPFAPGPEDPHRAAVQALTAGRNTADPWRLTSRALDAVGLLPGDVVIVDVAAPPRSGDVVRAEVYDWQRGKTESVFRIYEAPILTPASSDPIASRPYLIDDQTVMIKGVVVAMLRLPAQAPAVASGKFRIKRTS